METTEVKIVLKDQLVRLFEENKKLLTSNDTPDDLALREESISYFKENGFPIIKHEDWRFTNLAETVGREYQYFFENKDKDLDIASIFKCDVDNLNTYTAMLYNGWYTYKTEALTTFANGAVVGSLKEARIKYPEIFKKHYSKYANPAKNSLDALNTAFANDGIFIYIPDNVKMDKPIQLISITKTPVDSMIQPRNLVVVGKNSHLQLIHCDDMLTHQFSFSNVVTEIFADENSHIEHYKMQNNDNHSALISSTYFNLESNAIATSNTITLNGGLIRNNLNFAMNGEGGEANLYGIYLVDKEQLIDNTTFVDHIKPNCTSHELFKGIIDNKGKAVFNGKILVRRDAQKTNAFQVNKNILLTDEATINTKPNLEIYADDVKCSHGATVGQLDQDAMFYMRARGISEESARMLLLYAFADEVITKISIEALREKMCHLVSRRLKGELSVCDQCLLHCGNQEPTVFNIDLSKI
jgi:Fe-S cluster assembly protein SufD